MSTIREFVEKYLWKRTDDNWRTDNGGVCYPWTKTPWCNQCPSLIKQFYKQVFGLPIKAIWDAKEYFDNLSNSDYDKIRFKWDVSVCKRWDFIIWWKERWFWYWHIGIVMAYYKDNIYYIDQNAWSWNWNWFWWNAIQVRNTKDNFKGLIWFARYKNISEIINKDFFDKIVFEKGLYIWENNLKRSLVTESLFYFLAWYKDNLNWKTYRDLSITSNLNNPATRQELAYIILAFLNKILNKNLTLQDLKNVWIWNWQRPNDKVTGYEFTLMINKTKEVFGL